MRPKSPTASDMVMVVFVRSFEVQRVTDEVSGAMAGYYAGAAKRKQQQLRERRCGEREMGREDAQLGV